MKKNEFRIPFHYERLLSRFHDAIAETIDTLNTGKFRGRHISSKYQIRDLKLRSQIDKIVTGLVSLRAAFDKFLRRVTFVSVATILSVLFSLLTIIDDVARDMGRRRRELLQRAHGLHPNAPHQFFDLD